MARVGFGDRAQQSKGGGNKRWAKCIVSAAFMLLMGCSAVFNQHKVLVTLESPSSASIVGSVPERPGVPPATPCSDWQLDKLNSSRFLRSAESLSMETRCPLKPWFDELVILDQAKKKTEAAAAMRGGRNTPKDTLQSLSEYVFVSIGCNKGFDAVGTARLLSRDRHFDKGDWYKAYQNTTDVNNDRAIRLGACKRDGETNLDLQTELPLTDNAQLTFQLESHCVEPMPSTFARLHHGAKTLGLHNRGFEVHRYAISSSNGTVPFPTTATAGREDLGLASCSNPRVTCDDIEMLSLDDFADRHIRSTGAIDILTIDVEGYDFEVIKGGVRTLARARYLEFEYHNAGVWAEQKLRDAVAFLDGMGFTCYYLGKDRLFKLTGCWLDKYEIHDWSNVGCVHRSESLWARMMEDVFLRTIEKFD